MQRMHCVRSYKLVEDILHSTNKVNHHLSGDSIHDALLFGFSFLESEDHLVEYLIANPYKMKKILINCIEDVDIDPDELSIGKLWSAKLLVSKKLRDNQIVFSNANMSKVLNLNLNKIGDHHAHL